jgi:membrane protein
MRKITRHIITFQPIAALIRLSKRISPPGFQRLTLYEVLDYFRVHSQRIGFNERAAAISFNIVMAVPAFLMFLFTLVPYLPIARDFKQVFLRTIHDVLRSDRVYAIVQGVVTDITDVLVNRRTGLLSISIIITLFFASNAIMGVMRTFDRSFYQERKGRFMVKRWTAIKLTSILVMLILGTGLLLSTQVSLRRLLSKQFGWTRSYSWSMLHYVRWLVIVLLNYFSIACIYRFAPAVKVRWKMFSPGAIIACLLTIVASYLFSVWVNNFGKYNQLYGSLSTVLLLMNLIFFNALILLIGFELNVSITLLRAEKDGTPIPTQPPPKTRRKTGVARQP